MPDHDSNAPGHPGHPGHASRARQLDRLLFFSDAVFAIAITLLVIEIRLPALASASDAGLAAALLHLIPHFIGFIVSFFVIGRFWQGHHRLMGYLADWDEGLILRNTLFLFTIAFMPFPTAIISELGASRLAVLCYVGWLAVAGITNFALMRYVKGRTSLLAAPLTPAQQHSLRASWLPLAIALTAGLVAMVSPMGAILTLMISPFVFSLLLRLLQRAG